ncbi:Protein of unknown function DUF4432 [Moorella glycerini]|uniref:DUF4432 domain-containing protein n=1 Tax=Neomoorella stamsii TaxID=1266720 RepID=A0A9X7J2D4_9FIRM|nr:MULTISPECIES: aldose 1-epimerase family protein [Moorella]PRR72603.1 hypothetical protein MOST_17460 [Moorella stamsii]CEP67759.1 Protein of unknown function DUF4432 [Moorella glycerini]
MAYLFDREFTRRDIRRYFGSLEQVAGIRPFTYSEGRAEGLKAVEVRTGSGFRFVVLPGRGLDIGLAEYRGLPLAFRSAVGESGPQYFEPAGLGWLRNFGGGLLVTCGLTYLGSPCQDAGEDLGLHGRINNVPAEELGTATAWEGDECIFTIKGRVREAVAVFGPNVLLERTIQARLGENRLFIHDVVTNEGWQPAPHMILYHINLGYPVLDAGAELLAASREVKPRDEVAARGLASYRIYQGPTPGFPDTVFYHDLLPDAKGWCQAALVNRRVNLGVYVRYEHQNLPNFIQWKFTGEGDYVTGLEPANCLVEGRARERQRGTLVYLAPGEAREYRLEIGVLTTGEEIDAFARALPAIS